MQRAMSGFNAESAAQGLPPLVMGIAVHSGAVVAGNIGSQDRMKYGVVGPTVNLTGRIESLTIGPQILLSEATLGRVRHVVSVGPGIQVAVKGVPEPVTVYELTSVTGEAGIDSRDEQAATLAEVDLPAVALVVGEGKRIDETRHTVRVTRIGRDAIELVASDTLPASPLDLKVIVDFGGGATGGSYVRIAARGPSDRPGRPGTLVRAVFTSLDESDLAHIDRLLGAEITQAGAGEAVV
jgi:hypothetical protein